MESPRSMRRNNSDLFWPVRQVSKDDIKAFKRPRYDSRTGSSARLWIETNLSPMRLTNKPIVSDVPVWPFPEDRGRKPSRSSSQDEGYFTASSVHSSPTRRNRTSFNDLPHDVRQRVYTDVLDEPHLHSPTSPSPQQALPLQTLTEIHPSLTQEISLIIRPRSLALDLRHNTTWPSYHSTLKSLLSTTDLSNVSKIHLPCYKWYWLDGSDQDWARVPETFTISLPPPDTPASQEFISVQETKTSQPPKLCTCTLQTHLRAHGLTSALPSPSLSPSPSPTLGEVIASPATQEKLWRMLEFIEALRSPEPEDISLQGRLETQLFKKSTDQSREGGREEGEKVYPPLVKIAEGVVELIKQMERELRRESRVWGMPKRCAGCGGRRVYFCSFQGE